MKIKCLFQLSHFVLFMFSTETRCVLLKRSGSIQESIMGQYKKKASKWERNTRRARAQVQLGFLGAYKKNATSWPKNITWICTSLFRGNNFPKKNAWTNPSYFSLYNEDTRRGFRLCISACTAHGFVYIIPSLLCVVLGERRWCVCVCVCVRSACLTSGCVAVQASEREDIYSEMCVLSAFRL